VKPSGRRMKRVVAAFAAAPLGAAAAVAAIAFVATLEAPLDVAATIAATAFAFTAIIGYAVAVVLGIPGYLFFRHLGWVRRAHWILLCAGLGGFAGAIWPLLEFTGGQGIGSPTLYGAIVGGFILTGALLGAVSGLVFSLVIKLQPPRPDEIAATFD
jgi:hypothetical protein